MSAHLGLFVAVEHRSSCSRRRRRDKKLFLRRRPEGAQRWRRRAQWTFLLLNLWIGAQFYHFVTAAERAAGGALPSRPPGVEGWLPIAGLMNLKYFLATGSIPAIHPAAMFLLGAFLTASILFRKTFCSWLCPVGTVSERLWKAGRRFCGSNFLLPGWADLALRIPKYALLAAFLFVTAAMPANAIAAFLGSPYGLINDVKLLDLFRRMGATTAIVLSIIAVLSVFIKNFWCRFLCPYGALMGLGSLFSPVWVRRNPEACIECGKCRRACPSNLPVDTKLAIHSAECTGCLECVSACPSENALDLSIMGRRTLGRRATDPRWLAAGIFAIFFGFVLYAKLSGHWETPIPDAAYRRLIQHSSEYGHPH